MIAFLLSRLFSACLVVVGVSCIVFFLIHLTPGDPVEVMLGESAAVADREALRESLGLNQPLGTQFFQYFANLLQFDLGVSLHSGRAISELIAERFSATLQLTITAWCVAIALAFPLGMIAAMRRDSYWDYGCMTVAMLGVSIPNFVMGPVLILVFSLWLGWLPVSGDESWNAIILPAVTLGTALAAVLSRMVRATLLEVLSEDYIRTARAKGLTERAVMLNHAIRNAMLPVLTLLGLQLGALLAGAVITEVVFSWPGIGQLTIEAIHKRDYPVVQACVLLISLCYVTVNTLTDLVYAYFDPRVRLSDV